MRTTISTASCQWSRERSSVGHAERDLLHRRRPPGAPLDPAVRQHVDRRDLLGDARRVDEPERHQHHAEAERMCCGAEREPAEHRLRARARRPAVAEVVLDDPDRVEPELVGELDLARSPRRRCAARRRAGRTGAASPRLDLRLELVQQVELHAAPPRLPRYFCNVEKLFPSRVEPMPRPALAATRSAAILNFLAANPSEGFTLSDLAERLGINVASMHALLGALTDAGYLARHPRLRTYTLGPSVVALGTAALETHPAIDLGARRRPRPGPRDRPRGRRHDGRRRPHHLPGPRRRPVAARRCRCTSASTCRSCRRSARCSSRGATPSRGSRRPTTPTRSGPSSTPCGAAATRSRSKPTPASASATRSTTSPRTRRTTAHATRSTRSSPSSRNATTSCATSIRLGPTTSR